MGYSLVRWQEAVKALSVACNHWNDPFQSEGEAERILTKLARTCTKTQRAALIAALKDADDDVAVDANQAQRETERDRVPAQRKDRHHAERQQAEVDPEAAAI